MTKKKTRIQAFDAGEMPTFKEGDAVSCGGRNVTFVRYDGEMRGVPYAIVTHSFTGERKVQAHLLRAGHGPVAGSK